MSATFHDGTPVTLARLARRAAEALRAMARGTEHDLTLLAGLVTLVQAGAVEEAHAMASEIAAYVAERRQLLQGETLPTIDGLDADVALAERHEAGRRRGGTPVPSRSRRSH